MTKRLIVATMKLRNPHNLDYILRRNMSHYCKYCLPAKQKSHFLEHFDYYLDVLGAQFKKYFGFFKSKKWSAVARLFKKLTLEFHSLVGIVRFDAEPDESQLTNRGLIFFKEAKKRGIDIRAVKCLNKYIGDYRILLDGKKCYYQEIPLTINYCHSINPDDKSEVKITLLKNGFPTPEGKVFTDVEKALRYANEIGFPLVVKPNTGSLSQHVSCNINSSDELRRAIRIARIYRPDFIIERFINGKLYRATVCGRKIVFVCKKERASITGNGRSTVEELIAEKNRKEKRADPAQKNATLYKIPVDETAKANLLIQGLALNSIVPRNQKVYLQDKNILSQGCDIINCTDETHDDNRKLFLRVADILESDLVGIDFICPDIQKSYKSQVGAILETNSLPYIDMHQFPSIGNADRVAEIVWDIVLNKLTVNAGPN